MNPRPNILLFLMDGLQASALEPDSACITPVFDKFRAHALAFNRAYTTTPTCSPARASLMTGKERNGLVKLDIHDDVIEILSNSD